MPVRIMSFFLGLALLGATAVTGLKPINPVALQTMVDVTARELMLPGAVVLLRTPQGDFTAAYGTTQLGTTNRPGAGTYFRIASNTKTMAAAVIVQLAQEGKLKFSDPISKYVAGVPNGENITIAELLDMRSGLYNYTDAPEVAAIIDHDMTQSLDPRRTTGDRVCAAAQLRSRREVRILQYQLRTARPRHRKSRSQGFGRGDAGTIVWTARPAAYGIASKQRRHTPGAVFPRIPLWKLLGRLKRNAAVLARDSGSSPRRDASAK